MSLGRLYFVERCFSAETIFRNVLEIDDKSQARIGCYRDVLWQMGRKDEALSNSVVVGKRWKHATCDLVREEASNLGRKRP